MTTAKRIILEVLTIGLILGAGACSRQVKEPAPLPTAKQIPEAPQPKLVKASYYGEGDGFHGRKTASGERFNKNDLTAAHRTLPFGTLVDVTDPKTGKTVRVRINDRGPFRKGRTLDLSAAAAKQLGIQSDGVGQLQMKVISPSDEAKMGGVQK